MDAVDYVTIFWTGFAVFISLTTLYLSHLKGVDITLTVDKEKTKIEDLSINDFQSNIPTRLRGKTSFFVINKGNRTGAIRITNLKFNPDESFAKFFREFQYSLVSAKLAQNSRIPLPKTLIIKDGDADTIDMEYVIDLNPIIKMRYDYNLKDINIESANLKELFYELSNYKKEGLEKFINFLYFNEKLGKIVISYKYTKRQWLKSEQFKDEKKSLDVVHSYKETLEYYEDALKNYQLDPPPNEIIKSVISEIVLLKELFTGCYGDIEQNRDKELFGFSQANFIKEGYFDSEKNKIIELLKKCRCYKEIIERDIEPLLEDLLSFHKKTGEAQNMLQGKIRENLIDELKRDKEPLRRRLITESSKIKDLREMIEQELEEIS